MSQMLWEASGEEALLTDVTVTVKLPLASSEVNGTHGCWAGVGVKASLLARLRSFPASC